MSPELKSIITLKQKILFLFPLIVFLFGILIHVKGLILMDWVNPSLWILWVHFFMLTLNSAVVAGLLLKRWWGYFPAFYFCIYFTLNQFYYLVRFFLSGFSEPFDISNWLALFFSAAVTVVLWKNPLLFGIKRKPPFFRS